MQWEGQELNTQLFSPSGSAQEVPVSNNLTLNLSSAEDVTCMDSTQTSFFLYLPRICSQARY